MRLTTPERIRRFQIKLYVKAEDEPTCRFHQLYDKMYREDILEHAYRLAKSQQGAAEAKRSLLNPTPFHLPDFPNIAAAIHDSALPHVALLLLTERKHRFWGDLTAAGFRVPVGRWVRSFFNFRDRAYRGTEGWARKYRPHR